MNKGELPSGVLRFISLDYDRGPTKLARGESARDLPLPHLISRRTLGHVYLQGITYIYNGPGQQSLDANHAFQKDGHRRVHNDYFST